MREREQFSASEYREGYQPEIEPLSELPIEIREVFENTGYGLLAAETDIGVVHLCHVADSDIDSFADKPIYYQWQLIEMPTAPLLCFVVSIIDQPQNPYRFRSFLNIADETHANILSRLANQDSLYLAFYGDDFTHRFTKTHELSEQQWQDLDDLVTRASEYWNEIPPEHRDFDQAKVLFNELLL